LNLERHTNGRFAFGRFFNALSKAFIPVQHTQFEHFFVDQYLGKNLQQMDTATSSKKPAHFQVIDKSEISRLRFSQPQLNLSKELLQKLEYAMRLGNTHHVKVRLYFKSDEGTHMVETTVWACDAFSVCLKGGIWIPLNSILSVDFY
jgi:hypothetical protein